ncbi:MAG TPA: stage II sporulation protein M [Candidatus Acidoferrum sp.]|nr:stage II sporulation protein M [Candidatus Acidoferrum sp.]
MISNRWLEKRKPYWARLDQLVERCSRGVGSLNHSELQELGLLYRQTASDLATVREDASARQLASYLNQLLGRSHNLIYLGHKAKVSGLVHFYRDAYPQAFRDTLPQTLLAFAIFLVAGVVAWVVTWHDPAFAYRFLGPQMMETIEQKKMWTESIVAIKPLASSGIMTNNLSVSFSAFAMGITGGLGTIWMMAFNGLMIGVIGAATWKAGMALQLWSFVAPHGVLELPAIFIAGGAGLEIARGMLFPGYLPRRLSLAQAGGRASRLLMGTIPLLIVAGLIEGFFSPSHIPVAMKFSLAAVLFCALILYLFSARNTEQPKPSASATLATAATTNSVL